MTSRKKELGQFFSTKYAYILQGLSIPHDVASIIEPFVGNGDLVKFVHETGFAGTIDMYDIDPKIESCIPRDTIDTPPKYSDAFVITNPPYLARNKSDNKYLYDKYDTNDLYKCFLKNMIQDPPLGGIIIIPLNFFCSLRETDIRVRNDFLSKFTICRINIFEESVFDDTSYTVCSFQFSKNETNIDHQEIPVVFFPTAENNTIVVSKHTDWMFGGELFILGKDLKTFEIERLVDANKTSDYITNINLIGLDDGKTDGSRIRLEYDEKHYIGKITSRTKATLIIKPTLSVERQKKLIKEFNTFLEDKRTLYHSLFLTNYRESHDYARKRIAFRFTYNIVHYLLVHLDI